MNIKLLALLIFLCCPVLDGLAQTAKEHLVLADTLLWNDRYEEVATHLQQADSLLNANPDPDTRRHYQIVLGDYYLDMQKYPEAITGYEPLLEVPTPPEKEDRLQLAKAINDLGIAYYQVGRMDDAVKMHNRSLELYKDDLQGLSYNYNNLALIARAQSQHEVAMDYFLKSLKASEELPDSMGIGFNHLNIAALYTGIGKEVQALDHFYQARRIFEMLDRQDQVMNVNYRLGVVYSRIQDYEQALHHMKQAEEYYLNENKPRVLGNIYSHLSGYYKNQEHLDSAIYYARKSIGQLKPIASAHGLANAYHTLGKVYVKKKEYDRAIEYLDSSLIYSRGKFYSTETSTTLALAEILHLQGKDNEAIATALSVNNLGDGELPAGNEYYQAKILYSSLKRSGKTQEALTHLEKMAELKDSLHSQDRAMEIARLEYKDLITKRDEEQKAEQARQELLYKQERARTRWYLYSALGGALLLALLAYSYYRNSRTKKKDNRLLSERNETIAAYNQRLLAMNEDVAAKNEELQTMNEAIASKNGELQEKNLELQKLREKDQQHQEYEKQLLQESMEVKERELAAKAMVTHEKNTILANLEKQLAELQTKAGDLKPEVAELRKSVASNLNMKESWDSFVHQFENVHPRFFTDLKERHPDLTLNDLKLCAYIKVGMGNKEIAQVTNLALSTVKKSINRLKKKLELMPEDSVRDYLIFKLQ